MRRKSKSSSRITEFSERRISRRNFGLTVGLAAAVPFGVAQADTLFTSFAFQATGAPAARTMPARLAEVKNARDYGADPTGATDAQPAIQNATNAAIAAGGGTVFFPTGFYRVLSSITLNDDNASVRFLGEGAASIINNNGTLAGYIFDRHPTVANTNGGPIIFEKLAISNGTSSGGAIRIGSATQVIFRDCGIGGFVGITTEDSPGVSSQNVFLESCKIQPNTGGTGLIIGGSGAMTCCEFHGSTIAVLAYGNGFHMAGNRAEQSGTAYQLGKDSAGNNVGMSSFSLTSGSIEGSITGIDMVGTCSGGFIGNVSELGHPSSGPGEDAHTQYGLRVRAGCAQGCTFYGVSPSGWFDVAAVSIANASARANNVFVGCTPLTSLGPGVTWEPPTNAYTAQFIQCNTQPIWTYSQLPTGGDILEGDEFNISDGTNGLGWGDIVTNTGTHTTHYFIRHNGTNWTVVGK